MLIIIFLFASFQSELLIASESAKSSQRADLEGHLKSAESALAAKTAEAQKMEEKFQEKIRSQDEKSEALRDKIGTLETKILEKVGSKLENKTNNANPTSP